MFWFFVLLISLGVVRLMAPPILRALRGEGEEKAPNKPMRISALAAICLAPIAAAIIYFEIGAPESLSRNYQATVNEMPSDPRAEIAALPPEERAAIIENMVSSLAARLETDPDDVEGWRMLARSYAALGRGEESAGAYRELVTRDQNASREDWRNYAVSLLAITEGAETAVSDEALSAMTKLLSFNENEPLALFYLGMGARERGERDAAIQHWRKLIAVLPEDAPILPQLQGLIDGTTGEDG